MTFLEVMCLKKVCGRWGSKEQDKNVGEKKRRFYDEMRKPQFCSLILIPAPL